MTDSQYFLRTIQSLLNAPKHGEHDPYRPVWHFAPRVGLLNDPNGLSFLMVNTIVLSVEPTQM